MYIYGYGSAHAAPLCQEMLRMRTITEAERMVFISTFSFRAGRHSKAHSGLMGNEWASICGFHQKE
jgi:hypothetical protein